MTQTLFNDDHTAIIPHRADAYGPGPDGQLSRWMPASDRVGPTNLFTSVDDLIRSSDNFIRPRVGSPRLIERLTAPGWLNDGRLHGYACGLEIGRYRGLRMVSHGGIQHGYRARLALYPDQHVAIAILGNLSTIVPGALVRSITDLLVDHGVVAGARRVPGPARAPMTDEELSRRCGLLSRFADGLAGPRVSRGRPSEGRLAPPPPTR